jgi:hypothetical protein
MANIYNITTLKGDSWSGFNTTITKNASALDLTGAVIKMQLKKDIGIPCYVLEFSSLSTIENVITITEPLSGMFTVEPEIIDIPARTYVYDTQVTLADNTVITILRGDFQVVQDITGN